MDSLEVENLSVENIGGGRLAAHINEHINDVIEDIADPNKPAKAKRELIIRIAFAPSKSRREAKIDYGVTSKLAGMEKEEAFCYIGKVGGKAVASSVMVEQQPLQFETETEN